MTAVEVFSEKNERFIFLRFQGKNWCPLYLLGHTALRVNELSFLQFPSLKTGQNDTELLKAKCSFCPWVPVPLHLTPRLISGRILTSVAFRTSCCRTPRTKACYRPRDESRNTSVARVRMRSAAGWGGEGAKKCVTKRTTMKRLYIIGNYDVCDKMRMRLGGKAY